MNNRPVGDSGRDLALLRVKDGVYPALSMSSAEAKIGDAVHVLGFPGVVRSHEIIDPSVPPEASVTNGSVSASQKDAIGQDLIQTDASATYGNSGGPAIGNDAKVLGVMLAISLSSSGSAVQGFNFLIPIRDVRAFLRGTEVTRPGESAFEAGIHPVMLDVRTGSDFEASPLTLPGSLRLDPAEAAGGGFNLDVEPDRTIVIYDSSPAEATSARVGRILRARGWRNVRILKGGLGSWTNASLPVEAKANLPTIGLEIYKNLALGDVERRSFKAGDVIFREGADARGEAYLVHDGSVEIRKHIDGEHQLLRRHGEGDLFGELALFREGPRSTDAIATSDVELLVIPTERLDWLIHNRPALTKQILRRLAEWVVSSDRERGGM
jgi:rhodanese-related sulfurtransferase